jgi:hypothetical protein
MAVRWLEMQRRMDRTIDEVWAEQFEIHPWISEGYSGQGAPDTTRAVLKGDHVIGVVTSPGSRLVGETADSPTTQIIENAIWISVEQTVIGDPSQWKDGDRVYLVDRDEWYEINWIGPSATFRPNIHLTRLQEVDEA